MHLFFFPPYLSVFLMCVFAFSLPNSVSFSVAALHTCVYRVTFLFATTESDKNDESRKLWKALCFFFSCCFMKFTFIMVKA